MKSTRPFWVATWAVVRFWPSIHSTVPSALTSHTHATPGLVDSHRPTRSPMLRAGVGGSVLRMSPRAADRPPPQAATIADASTRAHSIAGLARLARVPCSPVTRAMIVTGASLRGRVGGQRRQGHAPAGTVPDSVDLQGSLM